MLHHVRFSFRTQVLFLDARRTRPILGFVHVLLRVSRLVALLQSSDFVPLCLLCLVILDSLGLSGLC